jgi:membrane associated rhomboid family serine protease
MAMEPKRKPRPIVTYALLTAMILIHLYLSLIPRNEVLRIYETYSLFPVRLFDGVTVDTLLTYIFLHGNWVHLFANLVSLLGAGAIVETDIGHLKFLGAFITSGIVAGLIHSLLNPSTSVSIIGASGAIFGIIAVLFLLMPFKITYTLMIPLPALAVGLILCIVELYSIYAQTDLTIAHDAHIAGFAYGLIYAFIVDKKRALKGLLVALIVLAGIYYIGTTYDLI